MNIQAATTELWGISAGRFLTVYLVLAALAFAGLLWQRRSALGPAKGDPLLKLGVYRLAMLSGGPQLAITTAAAKLHADGVLVSGEGDRTVVSEGQPGPDADPLEREVFGTVHRTPGMTVTAMRAEVGASETIARMTAELTDARLLVEEGAADRLRAWWGVGVVVAGLGLIRLVSGWTSDVSSGSLAFVLLPVVAGTIIMRRPVYLTRRGREIIEAQRQSRKDLRTYARAQETPLAIALFGGSVIWDADAACAATLGVPRRDSSGWGSSSCASGGGDGGGSSWGFGGDGGGWSFGGDGGSGGGCGGGGGGGCGGGGG